MEAMTENYQLKWHSFGTHLHSCVAASMKTNHFTDVVLVTVDGYQIAAHRFILSACSQYLHDILQLHYKSIVSTLSPLVIILPPEISSKSITILVQYMYSGEATVSKDILENVLRGGDLLKVKGLWRPKEDDLEVPHSSHQHSTKKYVKVQQQQQALAPPSVQKTLSSTSSGGSSQRQSRSSSESIPATIPSSSSGSATPAFVPVPVVVLRKSVNHQEIASTSKDVATTEGSSSSKKTSSSGNSKVVVQMQDKSEPSTSKMASCSSNNSVASTSRKNSLKSEDESDSTHMLVIKEEPIEWSEVNQDDMEVISGEELYTTTEMTIKPEIIFDEEDDEDMMHPGGSETDGQLGDDLYTPLTCELCAETFTMPGDWVKHVQTHTDMLPAKRQRRGRNSSEDESYSNSFPPLQCDMCHTYFPTPAEWVHHIQFSHTDSELRVANVDKSSSSSSSRPSTSTSSHTTSKSATVLRCTPSTSSAASSLQHIQITPVSTSSSAQQQQQQQQKACPVCHKTFPSHASMTIHSRTHTGERPYNCHYCCKGFNVKSNLLRHLRTLHDKIINSAEIENKDVGDMEAG